MFHLTQQFVQCALTDLLYQGELSEVEFTAAKSRMLESMKPVNPASPGNPPERKNAPRRIPPIPPVRGEGDTDAGDDGL